MSLDSDDFNLVSKIHNIVVKNGNRNSYRHEELMSVFNRIATAIEENTAEVRLMRKELGPQHIKKIK